MAKITEDDLINLGFEKIEYDHYYNYQLKGLISCDNDKSKDGNWYVIFDFHNSNGVISNKKILELLLKRI